MLHKLTFISQLQWKPECGDAGPPWCKHPEGNTLVQGSEHGCDHQEVRKPAALRRRGEPLRHLGEIAAKIRKGAEVRVVDAKTGVDLTQPTLAQVILEDRNAGQLLPVPLLHQLIRMGDDALADFLGRYVTRALEFYLQARQGMGAVSAFNPFASAFAPTDAFGAFLGAERGSAPLAGPTPSVSMEVEASVGKWTPSKRASENAAGRRFCCSAAFCVDRLRAPVRFSCGRDGRVQRNGWSTTMAETTKSSQVQQIVGEWSRMVSEQVSRVEAGLGELAKLENKAVAQAVTGFEEAGRIAKESLALTEKAGAEFRKLFLDATRRTAAMIAPDKA